MATKIIFGKRKITVNVNKCVLDLFRRRGQLHQYLDETRAFSRNTGKVRHSMTNFYKGFKLKKLIISEIKKI